MKHYISIITAILLLSLSLITSASADDIHSFKLFGDIEFRADYFESRDLLKEYGQVHTVPSGEGISSVYSQKNVKGKTHSLLDVTIAGIKHSQVTFAYNKDETKKLGVYQCLYELGTQKDIINTSYYSKQESDSLYLSIQKLLEKKYGIPNYSYATEQTTYALSSFSDVLNIPFSNCVEMVNAFEHNVLFGYKCAKVCEWLISLDDGNYVLINHFSIKITGSVGSGGYNNCLLYTFIDSDHASEQVNVDNWL